MGQQIFGRRNEDGKIMLLDATNGAPITRLDTPAHRTLWQPDGLGSGHEHPAGLVADSEEAARGAVQGAGHVWTGLD